MLKENTWKPPETVVAEKEDSFKSCSSVSLYKYSLHFFRLMPKGFTISVSNKVEGLGKLGVDSV